MYPVAALVEQLRIKFDHGPYPFARRSCNDVGALSRIGAEHFRDRELFAEHKRNASNCGRCYYESIAGGGPSAV